VAGLNMPLTLFLMRLCRFCVRSSRVICFASMTSRLCGPAAQDRSGSMLQKSPGRAFAESLSPYGRSPTHEAAHAAPQASSL